ncbi:hypothetical protein [Streptomyces brevispora]|uniref:Minor tail protein n=1 Tax=Streptomyces brevispora TaxID=887462 RepID=A0ABZ1G529_9ACTN|nr:hypothetical protein [Streptomyces brevispora]WSC14895.1 hypothetical protein OIE64_20020 [Streptomyces brevispora]
MSGAARDLARQLGTPGPGTADLGGAVVSAQVDDVTESGRVNLMLDGVLQLEVQCSDSYRNRTAGDWVAVRTGPRPVVIWRLGDDPGDESEAEIREIAADVAGDMIPISAYTWGTAAPAGSEWRQVSALWTRADSNGTGQLYAQLTAPGTPSPTPPATRPPKTATVTATDSGSWRGGRPDEYASSPMQGDWTGSGARRGAWFYGMKIQTACTGKTVSSMTVAFTRKAGSGVNGKRPLHLYLHGYTSPPTGQLSLGTGPEELLRLSVGAKGTATLPAAWRTALASGTARGLAIYTTGRDDYMGVTGGTITIKFSA